MTGQGDVAAPPRSRSRTVSAAWRDLTRGYGQRQLWLHLGWQDIKQRYRRSTLGPLWITIARNGLSRMEAQPKLLTADEVEEQLAAVDLSAPDPTLVTPQDEGQDTTQEQE